MQPKIKIKGIRERLLIILGEGEWDEVFVTLLENLDQREDFLRSAPLALDIGNHILKAAQLGTLRHELSERGLTLWVGDNRAIEIKRLIEKNIGFPRHAGVHPGYGWMG